MKKYYLKVFTNAQTTPWTYEVLADAFEWSNSGCYIFYTKDTKGNHMVSATYPIHRTIIEKIEDVDNKEL